MRGLPIVTWREAGSRSQGSVHPSSMRSSHIALALAKATSAVGYWSELTNSPARSTPSTQASGPKFSSTHRASIPDGSIRRHTVTVTCAALLSKIDRSAVRRRGTQPWAPKSGGLQMNVCRGPDALGGPSPGVVSGNFNGNRGLPGRRALPQGKPIFRSARPKPLRQASRV